MATKQFLISGTSDAPATDGTTEFSCLLGDGGLLWHATEENRTAIISTPGILTNFKVGVNTAPANGNSWTFTIRKGSAGGAMGDTALSVTISNTSVLSALDTDEVAVVAGDRVSIIAVGISVPTAAGAVYWTCQFTPTTDGETILLSNTGGSILTDILYSPLIASRTPDATEFDGQTLFPTPGTLKNFYVERAVAPGGATSEIFTVRKNGVATSMGVTISGTATTGSDTDPAHNVDIAAGDKVTIYLTIVGAPADSLKKYGITFLPDTLGEYIASATTDDTTSSLNVEYQHLNCGDTTLGTTENEYHGLAQATTAKAIYVNLETAPGNGNSWIFTLREGLADTALTVTLSGAAPGGLSGNAAVDEVIAADALINTSIDARAGTAISKSQIAYLFYNEPTVPPVGVAAYFPRSHGYIIG